MGKHPRWPELKQRLEAGSSFPIDTIDEDTRIKDLDAMRIRGNHKSVATHEDFLADSLEKEIKKGSILLLPDEDTMKIPDLELAPVGVADQLGVSATGYSLKNYELPMIYHFHRRSQKNL